jgi:hypothetical protein
MEDIQEFNGYTVISFMGKSCTEVDFLRLYQNLEDGKVHAGQSIQGVSQLQINTSLSPATRINI